MGPNSTPLVGRGAERAELSRVLAAAADGTGACVVLEGPAGIGKSRLLAAACAEAAALGMAVAAGRATELDNVAPLTALLTALKSSDPPVLADIAQLGDPAAGRFWLVDRLDELVQKYVTGRALLIVVDDMQWADELTALALRLLVPSLSSSPVVWLLARRPMPARTTGQDVVHRLIESGCSRVVLGPLDDGAVADICAHVLGARPDPTVLALAGRSGGNPFLIEEVLVSLRDRGQILVSGDTATAVVRDLPPSFLTSVEYRLRGLGEDVRRLLEAGSVLGRPFTVHEAARLLGRRPIDLVTATDEAIRLDVLVDCGTDLAFRHDLIREAVYNNLPGPVRQVLHREAAAVLEAEGRSPMEIAEHLVRCGPRGNRQAVTVVQQAVARVAPTAPGTAADLITRTLGLLDTDDVTRPGLVADAVRLLANVGRLAEARDLGETALRTGMDSATESALLMGLAEALKHAGQDAAVVEYTGRVLDIRGTPAEVRAHAYATRAHALVNTGDVRDASRAAADAVVCARTAEAHAALVHATAAQSIIELVRGDIGASVERAHEAVQTADEVGGEARHRHPRLWLGHALSAADRFTEAAAVYEVGRREAEQLGTAWSQPLWHYYQAELWAAKGMLEDAKAEAEAGVRIADQLTAMALSVPLLGTLAHLAVRRGDLVAAGGYLDRAQRLTLDGVGSRLEDLSWRLALYQDAGGQPQAAMETLSTLFTALPDRLLVLTQDPGAGPQLVRLALRTGARDKAEVVAAALAELAEGNQGISSLAGAAAHARGLLRGDLDALRAAVAEYEDSPRVLARALAVEDAGLAEHAAGDRKAAVSLLEEAATTYTTATARFDLDRVQRSLAELGVRRRSKPDAARSAGNNGTPLTQSELRVAHMVARGKTNREVAAELFLSRHTVDSHLRHIFAKLGMSSRVSLTRWVMEQDPPIART
ncbi:ATP-binding protein [Actinokineospora enzanensis]|uniref:ATP-binding protein n=1 Tax=Actinokineospora enzanensis TaxID=155975 RepID=UPI00037422DB|nr:LuxR family transcriptional regulator [Actinokineospora enzanensis]